MGRDQALQQIKQLLRQAEFDRAVEVILLLFNFFGVVTLRILRLFVPWISQYLMAPRAFVTFPYVPFGVQIHALPVIKVVNVALEACPGDPALDSHKISAVIQWAAQLVRIGVPERVK